MRLTAAAWLIFVGGAITSCSTVRGSGDLITINVPVEDFTRLVVSSSFDVNLTSGDETSLTLRVDDNIESRLSVGVSDDTLRIGLEAGTNATNETLEADLTVTSLEAIEGSGAVEIHLADNLAGSSLDLHLSGASQLDGVVGFDSMKGQVSGASNLSLSGRIGIVDVEASGASNLAMLDLEVDDLRINLSGASDAEVTVNDSIEGGLSGASSFRYRGDPAVRTVDISGASTIGQVTEPG